MKYWTSADKLVIQGFNLLCEFSETMKIGNTDKFTSTSDIGNQSEVRRLEGRIIGASVDYVDKINSF